jgi:hypothetical protein
MKLTLDPGGESVCINGDALGDVSPDFGQVSQGSRAYNGGHLLATGGRGTHGQALASRSFLLFDFPNLRRSKVLPGRSRGLREQGHKIRSAQGRTVGPAPTLIALPFGNLIAPCYPVNLGPDGFSSVGGEPLYDFRIKAFCEQ